MHHFLLAVIFVQFFVSCFCCTFFSLLFCDLVPFWVSWSFYRSRDHVVLSSSIYSYFSYIVFIPTYSSVFAFFSLLLQLSSLPLTFLPPLPPFLTSPSLFSTSTCLITPLPLEHVTNNRCAGSCVRLGNHFSLYLYPFYLFPYRVS